MFNFYGVPTPHFNNLQNGGENGPHYMASEVPQVYPREVYESLQEKYKKLQAKCEGFETENKKLRSYITELQELFEPEIKKRKQKIKRRKDNELSKEHTCPYPNCRKEYASELALSFHMRMKHNCGTKTERVAYLREYLEAKENGQPLPATILNLPPQVIEYELALLEEKVEKDSLQQGAQGNSPKNKRSFAGQQGSSDWSY